MEFFCFFGYMALKLFVPNNFRKFKQFTYIYGSCRKCLAGLNLKLTYCQTVIIKRNRIIILVTVLRFKINNFLPVLRATDHKA